jgi:hypothetical protein
VTNQARFLLGSLGYFLLIVVPILVYLKKRAETNQRIVTYTFVLWILWYLPYAPVHEGCHFVVGSLAGMHLKSHQFIPPFWRGDFTHGYVTWEHGEPCQMLLMSQAPYSMDGLIILIGLFLFRWRSAFTPFVGALILTQTFLRSVYDVAINYSMDTFFGGVGDFHFLLSGYPPLAVHLGAWIVMLLGASSAVREIALAKSDRSG